MPTGFAELDRLLPGGGWPQGALTELLADRFGIGELSLLMPALKALASRPIVWIAPPFIPYAPALVRQGLDLERLLVIFPKTPASIDRLWAVEQTLGTKPRLTVLAWLAAAGPVDLRPVDLRRLQLAVESQGSWAVLFRPLEACGHRSPAALRLGLERRGAHLDVEILKCRGGRPRIVSLNLPIVESPSAGETG